MLLNIRCAPKPINFFGCETNPNEKEVKAAVEKTIIKINIENEMFRSNFQEDKVAGGDFTKLQAVFSKLSGVLPRAEDLGNSNSKVMSSDIIESVLADTPVPVATSKSILTPSK